MDDLQAIFEALNVSVNAGAAGAVGVVVALARAALGLKIAATEMRAQRNRSLTVLLAMLLGVGAVWLLDPMAAELGAKGLIANGMATGLLGGGMAKATTAVRRRR